MRKLFPNATGAPFLGIFLALGSLAAEQDTGQIRECHARIDKQARSLEDLIEKSVVPTKCFNEMQLNQLRGLVNQLYVGLDRLSQSEPQQDALTRLLHDYNEVQVMLSACRADTIINTATISTQFSKQWANNLFLVAVGDVFGKNTGFEGLLSKVTVTHRLEALRMIKQASTGLTFIKDEDQAQPCAGLGVEPADLDPPHADLSQSLLDKLIDQHTQALSLESAFTGSIEALQSEMTKQLSALRKDESLFLPFSWTRHAFAFEITRESDADAPTYTFRLYNSGQGINAYHAQSESGYNIQFFPHLEAINVPRENLLSVVFLKALQEITSPTTDTSKPEDLYEKVFQLLSGKSNPEPYDITHFRDAQESGTCAYFSLPWVLDSAVARITVKDPGRRSSIAPRIEYLIGAITLKGYAAYLKTLGMEQVDEKQIQLLKKGLNFFSAQSLQSHSAKNLDYGDLASLATLGEAVRDEARAADSYKRQSNYQPFNTKVTPQELTFENEGSPSVLQKTLAIEKSQDSAKSGAVSFDYSAYTLPNDEAALLRDLNAMHTALENGLKGSRYVEVMTGISTLALKLPLQKPYWKPVVNSESVATQLIYLMRRFQTVYTFSLTQAIATQALKEKRFSAKDFLVTLKFLAVSDMLARSFVKSMTPELPSLKQPHFKWVLSDKSALAEVRETAWQPQLTALREYFAPQKEFDLFNFDLLPAGNAGAMGRYIFYDPKALDHIPHDQLNWTFLATWHDLKWVLDYMKSRPTFAAYREAEARRAATSGEGRDFSHSWNFYLDGIDLPRVLPFNPDLIIPESVSRTNDELDRRLAIGLLIGDRGRNEAVFPDSDRLPQSFYDLRAQAYLADYILTAQLDVAAALKLEYNAGVVFSDANDSWSRKEQTGLTKTLNVPAQAIKCTYEILGRCLLQGLVDVPEVRTANLIKHTFFRYDRIRFNVFGSTRAATYRASELETVKKDQNPFTYVRPQFHPQQAFEPISQFQSELSAGADFHHDELLRIYMGGIKDESGTPILDPLVEQERRRILPNDLIILDPSKEGMKKLTLERIRSIFTLSGSSRLQITETLALFDKFPSLLLRPEYQRLFVKLIFESELLKREYQVSATDTQRFLKRASDFCARLYKLFEQRGSLKAMTFILQMNQLFKDHWDFVQTQAAVKRPANFTPMFLDSRELLVQLAQKQPIERLQQQSFVYRNILETFLNTDTFSERDVELLLFANISHKTLPITDPSFDDPFVEDQIRYALLRKQPSILKLLVNPDDTISESGRRILANVVKLVRPDLSLTAAFSPLSVEKNNDLKNVISGVGLENIVHVSVFQAPAQAPTGPTTVQIDIQNGTLYDANQTSVAFPLSATEYQARFGNETHPNQARQIGYQAYEWTGGSGRAYRAVKDSSTNKWTFQMYFENAWYQYLQDHQAPRDAQGFFHGFDHWQSTVAAKDSPILVFDAATKSLAYRTQRSCQSNSDCTIRSVTRVKDNAVLAFQKEDAYPTSALKQIELPLYIYVWLKSTADRSLLEVELPRLGLTFKPLTDDPSHLDCAGLHAGTNRLHKIADVQYSALLTNPVNYVVCDNASSAPSRFAFSPIERFDLDPKESTLSTTRFWAMRDKSQQGDPLFATDDVPFAVYRLPLLEQGIEAAGDIEPTSDAARLYLALRHLWQLDYREAKEQMDEVLKSDRKLSQEKGEIKLLSWILTGRPDSDPRANAVRFVAGLNLAKQNLYFSVPFAVDDQDKTKTAYRAYLQSISTLASDWVPLYDELAFASSRFSGNAQAVFNRIQVLERQAGKEPAPKSFSAHTQMPKNEASALAAPKWTRNGLFEILKTPSKEKGLSDVRSSCAVIRNENFDTLYDIARAKDFDEEKARSLLSQLVSKGAVALLSRAELLSEWARVFRLNAETNEACRDLASFLLFVTKASDALPSASELQNARTRYLELSFHIDTSELRIKDLIKQRDDLKPPLEMQPKSSIWNWLSQAPNEMEPNPRYSRELDSFNRQVDAFTRTIDAERQKLASNTNAREAIDKDLVERLFNSVSKQPSIEMARYVPTIGAQQRAPLREPLPAQPKTSDTSFAKAIDLSKMNIEDPLSKALLPSDSGVFAFHRLTSDETQEIFADVGSLKQELDKGRNGPATVVAAIDTLKVNLDRYRDKVIAQSEHATIASVAGLNTLISTVDAQIASERKRREDLLNKALELAHKKGDVLSSDAYQRVLKLAGGKGDIAVDELTQALATNRLKELYQATNGRLLEIDLTELYTTLYHILLSSTFITHASAFLSALREVQTLVNSQGTKESEALNAAVKTAVALGRQTRSYRTSDHVEYLILEHYMEFLLRKEQADSLDQLSIKEAQANNGLGGMLEMIMGSGKTAVLLPLLSIMNSKDDWVNVIMLPESLVASMAKQLSAQLAKGFGQAVDIIEINRATRLEEQDILTLMRRFERARVEHRTIVTTNSSMQSLFLTYISAFHEVAKGNKEYTPRIVPFTKLFSFLRTHGRLTIDEADMALDILQAHQFSIKPRIPINETLSRTVFAFYRFLGTHDIGLRFPFLPGSRGESLSERSYARNKTRIIEAIASDAQLFADIPGLDAIYRSYVKDAARKKLLIDYLDAEQNESQKGFFDFLWAETVPPRQALFDDIDATFAKRDPDVAAAMKDIVTTLFEEINTTFQITASKKLQIHYGPLPLPIQDTANDESKEAFALRMTEYRQSRFLAIPYHAGNPVTTSRFGTAIESLNYTIQMHLEQKQYASQIQLELSALKKLADKSDEGSLKAFRTRYNQLRGDTSISVYDVGDETIAQWTNRIGSGAEMPLEFSLILSYVLPQVRTYNTQLYTNAQIYSSLFQNVQGFSGTLWSADTFPDVFRNPILSDTTEKTFYLLWSHYRRQKKANPNYSAIQALKKDRLLTDFPWAFDGSDIDDGGFFRGIDNEVIAKKKVSAVPGRSVIHYDEDGNIVVLDPSGSSVYIEEPHTMQPNRLALWDKKHTTGSDLKLRPNMKARLTFDHHTASRDIQQSVWRLRGLDKGQSIDKYLVLEEDLDVIKQRTRDTLKVDATSFDLGDLILYSIMNQELRLSNLLYRSTKQKMRNAFVRQVMNALMTAKLQDAISIYGLVRGLFETTSPQHPYLTSGFQKSAAPKDHVVQKERDDLMAGAWTKVLQVKYFFPNNEYQKVRRELENIMLKDLPKLPALISMSATEEGQEVEIETELEQEEEQELEVERKVDKFEITPNQNPRRVFEWPTSDSEAVFRSDYFKAIEPSSDPDQRIELSQSRPITRLSDAFGQGQFKWLAPSLSPHLLLSLNFAPMSFKWKGKDFSSGITSVFDFYNLYHKNLTNLLVIIDKNNNVKVALIDNNDTEQFEEFLRRDFDSEANTDSRDLRIGLYSLQNGLFRTGRDTIDMTQLEQNPRFVELLAQAKFLNGELEYTNDELDYLAKWISSNGVLKMYKFFVTDILKYKQDSREAMPHSSVGRLFETLRLEP